MSLLTTTSFERNLKISQLLMAGLQREAIKESIELSSDEIKDSLKTIKSIVNSNYSKSRLNKRQLSTLIDKRKIFKNVLRMRKEIQAINNNITS